MKGIDQIGIDGEFLIESLRLTQSQPKLSPEIEERIRSLKYPDPRVLVEVLSELNAPVDVDKEDIFSKPKRSTHELEKAFDNAEEVEPAVTMPPFLIMADVAVSPCTIQVLTIAGDCVGLVLAAMGIFPAIARRVGARVAGFRGLEKGISKFSQLANRLSKAANSYAKAQIVMEIAHYAISILTIKVLLRLIASEFEWYDWVLTVGWLGAELLAFLATDGAAELGELVILITSASFLTIDIFRYKEECH